MSAGNQFYLSTRATRIRLPGSFRCRVQHFCTFHRIPISAGGDHAGEKKPRLYYISVPAHFGSVIFRSLKSPPPPETFCSRNISVPGRVSPGTFTQRNISLPGHFSSRTLQPLDTLGPGYFGHELFRHCDISFPGRFSPGTFLLRQILLPQQIDHRKFCSQSIGEWENSMLTISKCFRTSFSKTDL